MKARLPVARQYQATYQRSAGWVTLLIPAIVLIWQRYFAPKAGITYYILAQLQAGKSLSVQGRITRS